VYWVDDPKGEPQISPLRYSSDFPWSLVALVNLMRLSLRKGAHADRSSAPE
jgi:hypothetical protein